MINYQYIYKVAGSEKFEFNSEIEKKLKIEKNKIFEKLLFRDNYIIHKPESIDRKKISNRREEWICKLTYKEHKNFSYELGYIYEFQVPLKIPKNKEYSKERGKIDLISINTKEKCVYLIEFKVWDNKENPWRAFLEIYTYYNMLGGEKRGTEFLIKLNNEYKKYSLKPIVLIERSKDEKSFYQRMKNIQNGLKASEVKLTEFAKNNSIKCYSCDVNDYIIKNVKEEF